MNGIRFKNAIVVTNKATGRRNAIMGKRDFGSGKKALKGILLSAIKAFKAIT